MAGAWLRDPRRLPVDPRFAQQILGSEVCVRDPRIIAQILGSEVCVRDPRIIAQILGSEVCVRDPRIIAQILGSEVCAAKSSDGPNPYFAHNKYIFDIFMCY